jgi:hypothetical protein
MILIATNRTRFLHISEVSRFNSNLHYRTAEQPSIVALLFMLRLAMSIAQPVKSSRQCWLVQKSGRQIPIIDTATPIINADGEAIGTIIVFQDNAAKLYGAKKAQG